MDSVEIDIPQTNYLLFWIALEDLKTKRIGIISRLVGRFFCFQKKFKKDSFHIPEVPERLRQATQDAFFKNFRDYCDAGMSHAWLWNKIR